VASYPDTLTIREARARYFALNGFGEGGYDARWVRLQAGPIAIYFPNTAARVRAVRLHDVHHVVTEYETTWTGEAEIGAWEIASGCADHHAAWLLNLLALAIGLAIAPRRVFVAFVRGRRSANLYRAVVDEPLLAASVAATRRRLRLDHTVAAARPVDVVLFAVWSALAVATLLATAALVLTPVAVVIRLATR
jgi:hypothetical protein